MLYSLIIIGIHVVTYYYYAFLFQPISKLSEFRDFLSPIVIRAEFSELPRPTIEYVDGSPVSQQDYRDSPLITVAGNASVNVIIL